MCDRARVLIRTADDEDPPLRSTSAARCARSIHEATEQPPPAKPDHLVYHPIEGGEKGSNGRVGVAKVRRGE